MIGYTTIGVADMDRAKAFYLGLFADQGAKVVIDAGRIAFIGTEAKGAMLAVCEPYDGQDCSVGNGSMLAFPVAEKQDVDKLHQKALSLGATDDGEPGQRVPDRFYGAYARDPDGNKICFYIFA